MQDIMIDFETWGTRPGSAVRSLGALSFDPYSRKKDSTRAFYANIKEEEQLALGLTKDSDTVDWWSRQSLDAQNLLIAGQVPIEEVMVKFVQWFRSQGGLKVWSQGSAFDCVIIEDILRRLNIPCPWKFWNTRDTRTVYDMFGFDMRSLPRKGIAHHALFDCDHQVECVWAAQESGRKRWVKSTAS